MAESTGLLNLHTGNRITSSNLVLSAKKVLQISAGLFWITEPVEVTSLYTELWTLLCLLSNDQLSVFGGFTLRLMCYLLD